MQNSKLEIDLPQEFIDLCATDGVTPEQVIKGFIADLAEITSYVSAPRDDGYSSNGSDERMLAREYYSRVGYPYWNEREEETVLFCCDTCDEEYHLPEGTTQCPVCGDEIEPCQ